MGRATVKGIDGHSGYCPLERGRPYAATSCVTYNMMNVISIYIPTGTHRRSVPWVKVLEVLPLAHVEPLGPSQGIDWFVSELGQPTWEVHMPDTRALNQCYKRWREISTMIPIWEHAYIDHSLPFALLAPLLGLLRVLGHCGHFSLVAFFFSSRIAPR